MARNVELITILRKICREVSQYTEVFEKDARVKDYNLLVSMVES